MRQGIPIPHGLFDQRKEPPSIVHRAPSPSSTLQAPAFSNEYKRSTSMTVVEGRTSTDVWIAKGEAVDGKGKIGRALGMLAPAPKLSVLPPQDSDATGFLSVPLTPPLPIQDFVATVPPTPQSTRTAELGHHSTSVTDGINRARTKSTASSARLSGDEHAFQARVMVAQRHYSHMAMTMVLPPSPERDAGGSSNPVTPTEAGSMAEQMVRATGVSISTPPTRGGAHLRTRSVTSWSPPRFPSTPGAHGSPTALSTSPQQVASHRKSYSSFDFGAVQRDEIAEIDKLSAGLLPLLVPGLRVGSNMRISCSDVIPSPSLSNGFAASSSSRRSRSSNAATPEFGGFNPSDFSSPQIHSTPYRRPHKTSAAHKRAHLSLPRCDQVVLFSIAVTNLVAFCSLGLGKDGMQSLNKWIKDTDSALEAKVEEYRGTNVADRRKTLALIPQTARPVSVASRPDFFVPSSPASIGIPPPPTPPPAMNLPNVPVRRTPRSSRLRDTEDRNSLALLIAALEKPQVPLPLPSAGSEVTMFDLEDIAPLAESTPPDYRRRSAGRSSISYVRSEDSARPPRGFLARAVKPLVAKRLPVAPKPDSDSENPYFNDAGASNGYAALPSAQDANGLRPLSLLQSQSMNAPAPGVRGLSIKKRGSKSKRAVESSTADENGAGRRAAGDKENGVSSLGGKEGGKMHRRLRSLKLGRSDTTKERATLRATEAVPEVVVRPPSDALAFGFGFR
jgi:hypothetical protein